MYWTQFGHWSCENRERGFETRGQPVENPVSVSLEVLLCAMSNGQMRKLSEGEKKYKKYKYEEGKEYEKYEEEGEKEYEKDEKEGDPRDWKYCTQASQIVLPTVGFGFFPWTFVN